MTDQELTASFVGRSRELEEVERLLFRSRLVTVMGAPGIGKTRLALKVALRVANRFPAGVFTCELAPVVDPALAQVAVAEALGFAPEVRGDLGKVASQRFGQDAGLLVVDNCEHVRADVSLTLGNLLASAHGLRILATSRERLRMAEETAWILPSMSLEDALQLLVSRVAAHDAAFAVTPGNRDSLIEIWTRLDGLPLALELVAPRLALVPARQVARMLDDALGMLAPRDGKGRQRTMKAALDWSVALLTPHIREDFWRLAVFPASFTLDAAAAVLAVPAAVGLDRLAELRDASLLVADTAGASARFKLLEPIRQYAVAQLAGAPFEVRVRRRHAEHVLGRAKWIGARLLGTPEHAAALVAFEELLPDLRQAVAWAFNAEAAWAVTIVGQTGWAWEITSRLREGEALERKALEVATSADDKARLLTRIGSLVDRRSRLEGSTIAEAAIAAARNVDDPRELGLALCLGFYSGTRETAAARLDEAATIAAESDDTLVLAFERFFRAHLCYLAGDLMGTRTCFEAALAVSHTLGDHWLATQTTTNLIRACLELGDNQAARNHLRSILPLLLQHPNWVAAVSLLNHSALLASRSGRPADALRLVAAQRRLCEEIGAPQWVADTAEIELAAHAELRPRSKEKQCLAEGVRLSLSDALALARAVADEPPSRPVKRRSRHKVEVELLTKREQEVVSLVAGGLTNRQIAARLFITERSAEGHVERIRNKLDVRSRAQVAAWAVQQGLVTGEAFEIN